ncbi:MAG: prepilin-type N-terminal cleavage/methylation domain-containing protein [Sedimentibacter sp.]|uniref:pilus assembly FimT family protein n=1 Tax=Sedimentibacter sp. TaxID=1960295 RepID=UPI0029819987|nr:prepilin-type N-terminal cleavage/methylation domain-containing protein [Sedimentibacter sp.]MDW5300395.1 prepilin-type N-terminal cleavage/methylation domain-containing protein [Sedimentibacter sp.]
MNNVMNKRGLTVIEIIMTLAVLGVVICPLMNMFITSQRIINFSDNEYKSIQTAQMYMEEIKAMDELNTELYIFNSETGCYERNVSEADNNYGAEIAIDPNSIIYYISIDIISEGEIISSLAGSKVYE